MKRLVDEATDELTRSLLEAGRTHRPPAGNETKLLLALGVGSSVGLLSSKAFAWLGSGAGKLTLVGVGVGIAGVAYTLASPHGMPVGSPPVGVARSVAPAVAAAPAAPSALLAGRVLSEDRAALRPRPTDGAIASGATASGATASGATASGATASGVAGSEVAGSEVAGSEVAGSEVPMPAVDPALAPGGAPSSEASASGAASKATLALDAPPNAPLDRAHGSRRHMRGHRGRTAVASHRALAEVGSESPSSMVLPSGAMQSGPAPSGPAERDGNISESQVSEAAHSKSDEQAHPAASNPVRTGSGPGLESEVALVDAMRGAFARGDGAGFRRLIESYRGSFPDGQLRAEVAELAARPLPSAR